MSLGSYNIPVNPLAADMAASLLLVPRVVKAMKWSTPFCITTLKTVFFPIQNKEETESHPLSDAWQDVRCRTADRQQHKSNAQEQNGAYLLYW